MVYGGEQGVLNIYLTPEEAGIPNLFKKGNDWAAVDTSQYKTLKSSVYEAMDALEDIIKQEENIPSLNLSTYQLTDHSNVIERALRMYAHVKTLPPSICYRMKAALKKLEALSEKGIGIRKDLRSLLDEFYQFHNDPDNARNLYCETQTAEFMQFLPPTTNKTELKNWNWYTGENKVVGASGDMEVESASVKE